MCAASDDDSPQLPGQHDLLAGTHGIVAGDATLAQKPTDITQQTDSQCLQPAAQRNLHHWQSSRRLDTQVANSQPLVEATSESLEAQLAQVLRRRSRSRLQLTQGGVLKGLMCLGKHRSGRVSPEKASRQALSQNRGLSCSLAASKGDLSGYESASAAASGRQTTLKSYDLAAEMSRKKQVAAHTQGTASLAAKQRLSMRAVLLSSLQQVEACTAQLQQQNTQQQQLQRSLQVMTADTVSIMDLAITAAVDAQQQDDV